MPARTCAQRVKEVVKDVGDAWFWRQSKSEIHDLLKAHPTGASRDILPITGEYRGQGWYKGLGAYQIEEEFKALADWATSKDLRTIVEIGTASGATLLLWARVAKKRVISIDLPGGIHGGGYAEKKGRLFKEFVHDRPDVELTLIRASSQDTCTRQQVETILSHDTVDLLFIDGDHRLEAVRRDFELWRDLVRPGGTIVLHDILPHHRIETCQVHILWDAIRRAHPAHVTEIVASREQGWAGIGILTI